MKDEVWVEAGARQNAFVFFVPFVVNISGQALSAFDRRTGSRTLRPRAHPGRDISPEKEASWMEEQVTLEQRHTAAHACCSAGEFGA